MGTNVPVVVVNILVLFFFLGGGGGEDESRGIPFVSSLFVCFDE